MQGALSVRSENFDIAYYDDLVGNVKVEVLDELNKTMYAVDLQEAFPQNVSAISVGWGTNTDYMKFSVTFSYRKWKRLSSNAQGNRIIRQALQTQQENPQGEQGE